METELVYILGAGASKDAFYPLYTELLSLEYIAGLGKELEGSSDGHVYTHLLAWLCEECSYFSKMGLHFEELLHQLECTSQADYERAVQYYIRLLLAAGSLAGHTFFQGDRYRHLLDFARFLLAARVNRIAILSFNHDLLIEHALNLQYERKNRADSAFTYDLDRGTCYDITGSTYGSEFTADSTPKIMIYKLHGSMNWLHCPNCGTMMVGGDDIAIMAARSRDDPRDRPSCPKCSAPLRHTIIPPKRLKEYPPFQNMWRRAAGRLRMANEIVLIGYSMPDYDTEATRLLMTSIQPQAIVWVVNICLDQQLRARVTRLPGKSRIGIPLSFRAYVTPMLHGWRDQLLWNLEVL